MESALGAVAPGLTSDQPHAPSGNHWAPQSPHTERSIDDMNARVPPADAALDFVESLSPRASAAFLGVSAARTDTSDLDIVIVGSEGPYRESFVHNGWPVEAFVHTPESWRAFFASDVARRRPSLPYMCGRGIVLIDVDGLGSRIAAEARALLDAGPPPLTPGELAQRRYRVTDSIDDLIGSRSLPESLFIGAALVHEVTSLSLGASGRWEGEGKWSLRLLKEKDPESARAVVAGLRRLATGEDPAPLIAWAESELRAAGGRLFEGYRASGYPLT